MGPRKRPADDGNDYRNASQLSSSQSNSNFRSSQGYSSSQGHHQYGSSQGYSNSQPTSSQGYSRGQNGSSQGRPSKQARTSGGYTGTSGSQADPFLIDDDEDDSDENATDPHEAESQYQLYGSMASKIVGVRYYRGNADVGEFIIVRREPQNQYDGQFLNLEGTKL